VDAVNVHVPAIERERERESVILRTNTISKKDSAYAKHALQ